MRLRQTRKTMFILKKSTSSCRTPSLILPHHLGDASTSIHLECVHSVAQSLCSLKQIMNSYFGKRKCNATIQRKYEVFREPPIERLTTIHDSQIFSSTVPGVLLHILSSLGRQAPTSHCNYIASLSTRRLGLINQITLAMLGGKT